MPAWGRTIDLKPAVEIYTSTGDIPKTAEKAVEIIQKSGWLADTPDPDCLRGYLDRLKSTTSASDYEAAFEWIYDVADIERVWIETS